MTKKRLSYQVLEDNGGGLHLAVFDGDECIYYASGLEHQDPADVQDDLAALRAGDDPRDVWEVNLPDGYTPQQLYDDLTSREYGWEIIADDVGVYPERMGAAGCAAFGLDDTISYEVDLLELTKQESGIIIYGDEVIVCNWASFKGLPKVFAAGLIDWPARIPMVAGVHVDDLSPLLRSKKIIYNANDDELPQSGTVYRIQEDIIVIGPDGWG